MSTDRQLCDGCGNWYTWKGGPTFEPGITIGTSWRCFKCILLLTKRAIDWFTDE